VGYVGSEAGTQLSNFMGDNSGNPSVVLLDEFDHCDPETWEAFYHIFDEGPILFVDLLIFVLWCGMVWYGMV
jgi:ATP-dependent Clp protease ATP-binding subunit ClpA